MSEPSDLPADLQADLRSNPENGIPAAENLAADAPGRPDADAQLEWLLCLAAGLEAESAPGLESDPED